MTKVCIAIDGSGQADQAVQCELNFNYLTPFNTFLPGL